MGKIGTKLSICPKKGFFWKKLTYVAFVSQLCPIMLQRLSKTNRVHYEIQGCLMLDQIVSKLTISPKRGIFWETLLRFFSVAKMSHHYEFVFQKSFEWILALRVYLQL